MEAETHIIRRQKFSVLHHGNTNVFALQQASEQFCKERVLPALEKMFDKISEGKTIYIPKFNLDLSVSSLHDLNELLVQDIVEQLKREVILAKKSSHGATLADGDSGVIRNFMFYLKHGMVSGNDCFLHRNIWIENILELLRSISKKFKVELYDVLQFFEARKNLAALTSDELFWNTMAVVSPGQALLSRLKQLYNKWKQLVASYAIHFPAFHVKLYLANLVFHAGNETSGNTIMKIEALISGIKNQENSSPIHEIEILHEEVMKMAIEDINSNDSKKNIEEKKNDQFRPGNTFFVPNAGLIIIHPFLTNFFTNIALPWKNGIAEKERAVTLLHYIATGLLTMEPYEQVLPKLLLDVPFSETIMPAHIITDKEKSEVDNLLKALINHWTILKNTSPDSLRQSFLQRSGIANEKDGKYSITIEKGPYDVVLDHLPWTISMIKLPWMKGILNVKWGGAES